MQNDVERLYLENPVQVSTIENLAQYTKSIMHCVVDGKLFHHSLQDVFKALVGIVRKTFLLPPHSLEEAGEDTDSRACFPNLPRLKERGKYLSDSEKVQERCSKKGPTRTPTRTPGVFSVLCPHG